MKPSQIKADPKSVALNSLRLSAGLTAALRQNLKKNKWRLQWVAFAHHLTDQCLMGLSLAAEIKMHLQIQKGMDKVLKQAKKAKGKRGAKDALECRHSFGKLRKALLHQEYIEEKSSREKYRNTMKRIEHIRTTFAHPCFLDPQTKKPDIHKISYLVDTFLKNIDLLEFLAFERYPIEWDSDEEREEVAALLKKNRKDLLAIRKQIRAGALA